MFDKKKILKTVRPNSSIAGAALLLGLSPATLEEYLPLLTKAEEYNKSPSKSLRDEVLLRLDIQAINYRAQAIIDSKNKQI